MATAPSTSLSVSPLTIAKVISTYSLTSALVQSAGECRAALKLRDTLCHRSIEAAPMCSSQVLGYDQLDTLAEYLLGRIAKQRGRGLVSANDRSRAVGRDDSVSDVMEYPLGQFGLLFHEGT